MALRERVHTAESTSLTNRLFRRLVRLVQSPYDADGETMTTALYTMTDNDAVQALRDEHEADLVQLFASFSDYCAQA